MGAYKNSLNITKYYNKIHKQTQNTIVHIKELENDANVFSGITLVSSMMLLKNNMQLPRVTKTKFLIIVSIQYQADK